MSTLPPEQQEVVDAAVRRAVAAATLKKIHRLIEEEKADELKGQQFSAIVTSVVLGALALGFALFIYGSIHRHIRIGVPATDSLVSGVITHFLYAVLTVWLAVVAVYFWSAFPGPIRRYAKTGVASSIVAGLVIGVIYLLAVNSR